MAVLHRPCQATITRSDSLMSGYGADATLVDDM